MTRSLLFTTMITHRPVYIQGVETNKTAKAAEPDNKRKFHLTVSRDVNKQPAPVLRDILRRSTQPTFSVSAMFGVRSGGGCGSCGH
jgi:hypothetical protein